MTEVEVSSPAWACYDQAFLSASVNRVIRQVLQAANPPTSLEDLLSAVLLEPDRSEFPASIGRKSNYIAKTYLALGGREFDQRFLKTCAALELIILAFDIIDDVQDGEAILTGQPCPGRLEMAQWINVALYLIFLGQQLLDTAEAAWLEGTGARLRLLLNQRILSAIGGQANDLSYEGRVIDLKTALEMTALKSGSLVQALYEVGAGLAGACENVVKLVGQLGWNNGIISQLRNDLHDLCAGRVQNCTSEEWIDGTDIARRKKTVPIVFALNHVQAYPSEAGRVLQQCYTLTSQSYAWLDLATYRQVREVVWQSGAPAYVQLIMAVHKAQADQLTQELAKMYNIEASVWLSHGTA